jgi:hypothetical protein
VFPEKKENSGAFILGIVFLSLKVSMVDENRTRK